MEGPTCKTEVRLQIKNAFLEIYKLIEKMISLYFGLSKDGKCREISGQSSICFCYMNVTTTDDFLMRSCGMQLDSNIWFLLYTNAYIVKATHHQFRSFYPRQMNIPHLLQSCGFFYMVAISFFLQGD